MVKETMRLFLFAATAVLAAGCLYGENSLMVAVPDTTMQKSKGGTLAVGDIKSPINGAKIIVLPTALSEPTETISISYQSALPGLLGSAALAMGAVQASKCVLFHRSGAKDLSIPALITIPWDSHAARESDIPQVLGWDTDAGKYHPQQVVSIDRRNGFIVFRADHLYPFIVAVIQK